MPINDAPLEHLTEHYCCTLLGEQQLKSWTYKGNVDPLQTGLPPGIPCTFFREIQTYSTFVANDKHPFSAELERNFDWQACSGGEHNLIRDSYTLTIRAGDTSWRFTGSRIKQFFETIRPRVAGYAAVQEAEFGEIISHLNKTLG